MVVTRVKIGDRILLMTVGLVGQATWTATDTGGDPSIAPSIRVLERTNIAAGAYTAEQFNEQIIEPLLDRGALMLGHDGVTVIRLECGIHSMAIAETSRWRSPKTVDGDHRKRSITIGGPTGAGADPGCPIARPHPRWRRCAGLRGLTPRDARAMRKRFPDPAATWTDDNARTLLEEWRRSGDSIAAFARRRSVSAWRLYAWRTKLGTTAATPRVAPTLSLVPASIVAVSGVTLTVRLPGEVSIDVANASPSWVAALVAELTRPS